MSGFKWTNPAGVFAACEAAVMEASLFIEEGAKVRCPVDTGNLRRSIKVDGPMVSGSGVSATVGTNVHYAAFVELGTRKMQAQPYLGPALEQARSVYG